MVDWTASMTQTFEYYIVDPNSWKDVRAIQNVKSCKITRDSESETLGSATIDAETMLTENYVRVYLVTIQNGITERHPLGTFLVQTPSSDFDGKTLSASMDAYTPLLELKENPPPLGYSISKNSNVLDMAYAIVREKARAPVVKTTSTIKLYSDFVSNTSDTWLTFTKDLLAYAKYHFDLDEMGRILFAPQQELASLQPIFTYNTDNSSILLPTLSMEHDLYGIPNVVEVIYSAGTETYYARVVNDDSSSPTSTISRGREIIHRVTNPGFTGVAIESQIQEYAEQLLKALSTLQFTVTYTHGYCGVRVGDCIRLNYEAAGLSNVKAKVISQSISCEPGCPVTEKAIFTKKLWR